MDETKNSTNIKDAFPKNYIGLAEYHFSDGGATHINVSKDAYEHIRFDEKHETEFGRINIEGNRLYLNCAYSEPIDNDLPQARVVAVGSRQGKGERIAISQEKILALFRNLSKAKDYDAIGCAQVNDDDDKITNNEAVELVWKHVP